MYYNIHYDIAAAFLLGVLVFARYKLIRSGDKTNIRFMMVLILSLITCLFDIAAALCFSKVALIGNQWMLVIETVYLIMSLGTSFAQLQVVCARSQYESETFLTFNIVLIVGMILLLLINIGTHFIFEYDNEEFIGYPLFNAIYIVGGIFFLEMVVVLLVKGRNLRKKIIVMSSAIFIFPVLCIIVQFFYDNILLSGLGATAALTIFSFTLGDENYESLQETIQELEESREQEQKNRANAEAANRVKDLFMENVSNEFRYPIKEVLYLSEKMRFDSPDAKTNEYIDEINDAGNQLLQFIDELLVASGSAEEKQ